MNRFINIILLILAVIFIYNAKVVYAGVAPTSCSVDQITDTTRGFNIIPSINSDGTRIAFVSDSDITGDNGDGNDEIFLFDTDTSMFTQITATTGGEQF